MQEPGDADRGSDHQRGGSRILSPAEQRDHHSDQRDVEQERRERRQRKAGLRVHERHYHRDGTCEGEVGQHQPRVVDRQLQGRMSGKPRREHGHDKRHQQADQRCRREQRRADGAEDPSCKSRRCHCAFGLAHAQPGRHQRRVQRALGQQPSHDIDQLKRHQECIRDRACAEQRRNHRIARESEQPRGKRSRRYGEEGTDHEGFYTAWLAGAGLIVIGRCTLRLTRLGPDFPRNRNCRNRTDG